ncbi:MAG: FGGY-family carbohydrate kinase [Prochloraceae cyanobacterium]|nr:FGGY-family carbohydrate kinase [Prochloraceae cyanobacterium]
MEEPVTLCGCQWIADICGCQVVAGPPEATALGNLLIQAQTMGHLPKGVTIREIVRNSSSKKVYQSRNWPH